METLEWNICSILASGQAAKQPGVTIKKLLENFEHIDASKGLSNYKECDTCQKPNKVCKLVCDGDKEEFTAVKKTTPVATSPTTSAAVAPAPATTQSSTPTVPVDSSGSTTNVQVKPDQFVKPATSTPQPNYMTGDEFDYNTYGINPYASPAFSTGSNFNGMFYENTYPLSNNIPENPNDKNRQANEIQRVIDDQKAVENRAYSTTGYNTAYQQPGAKSETLKTMDNQRTITGTLDDEVPYGDYNHLPMAAGYKSHDYEYGYNYIPPEKWYPQPVRPPICVTNFRSPVYASLANGTPTDVKEFYAADRITQPYRMNTAYVEQKLNSGR